MRRFVPATLLVVGLVVVGWLLVPRTDPGPNVLLISIDTLRRDHVSAYGYERATTPILDAVAGQGALFENAWTPSSWTLPAHISALTGLPPSIHQVEGERDSLADDIATLAEELRAAGHTTAGITSHLYLDAKYGFNRGFDEYVTYPDQIAAEVSDRAVAWLERHDDQPFFLFLHYFDPHADYAPPERLAREFDPGFAGYSFGKYGFLRQFEDPDTPLPDDLAARIIALYDAEIRYTDEQIGRVLDALRERGRLNDTIVVVLSDHGEEFKEHGSFGHGGTLYAEVTRIPLIARFPARIPAGTRVDSPFTLADVPGMILSLSGLVPTRIDAYRRDDAEPAFAELEGRGAPDHGRRLIFETTRDGAKRFATLHDRHAYVPSGRYTRLAPGDASGEPSADGLERRWIAIPKAVYGMVDDPNQHTNLLDGDRGGTAAAIAQDAAAAILSYVVGHSRGVRLVCRSTEGRPTRFEGTIRFEQAVRDEPFGYNLSETDAVIPIDSTVTRLRVRTYGLELEPADREKGVVFAPALESTSAEVALLRDGAGYFSGTVELPAPGQQLILGDGAAVSSSCRLEGGIAPFGGGRAEVSLSDEEIERLRSLGYLE